MAICKFCCEERRLVDAHIIPESLYPFDGGAGRQPLIFIVPHPHYRKSRSPKGVYDPEILCEACERQFSSWDDAAHRLFNCEDRWIPFRVPSGKVAAYVAEGDYVRLKLFFISLLWRAHITSQPMFRHVQLGPWASIARQHIVDEDPGSVDQFSVVLERYVPNKYGSVILDPRPQRLLNRRFYRFYLGNCIAHIKVDALNVHDPFDEFVLRPDKPIIALARRLEDAKELAVMRRIAHKAEANAIRV